MPSKRDVLELMTLQYLKKNPYHVSIVPCNGPFTVWHFASELANYKTNELNLQKDFTIAYSGSDFSDEQKIFFSRRVHLGYLFIEKKDQSCRRSCNRGNP